MSTVTEENTCRVLFSRHRKGLKAIFEEAGNVVQEGADVGGDVRVAWDGDNDDECRAVEKLFQELSSRGFTAIKVGDNGKLKDGERLDKFERHAGRLVLMPKMAGGE